MTRTARPSEAGTARPTSDPVQDQIAAFAKGVAFDDLPAEAVHAAKGLVIDTVGVFLAGFGHEPCERLRNFARDCAAVDSATLIGTRRRTTPETAALVNATTARYLEANDVFARYKPGTAHGHPSDVIMPLLAVAESTGASGAEFLNSIVLAYEIYLRICDACHSEGFDATTFGSIGIAAATSKLFGLSVGQIGHAVAMSAAAHNILKQVRADDVTIWKALAAGEAGRAGIHCAMLARAGFEGPSLPFVGSRAWRDHVAGTRFELNTFEARGIGFLICESRIKTRPARALTISAILAAEKIAGDIDDPATVSGIEIATYGRAVQGTGPEHWKPGNRATADHSVPYCVAAALLDGIVTPSSFDEAHLDDPRLRGLMAKMEVVEDDASTAAFKVLPQSHRTRVTVRFDDGRSVTGESGGDEDDLATPKSDGWIETKFRSMAGDILGEDRTAALLRLLWDLDGGAGLGDLIGAMEVA